MELSTEEQELAVTAFLLGHAQRLIVAAQQGKANTEAWRVSSEQFLSAVESWIKQ